MALYTNVEPLNFGQQMVIFKEKSLDHQRRILGNSCKIKCYPIKLQIFTFEHFQLQVDFSIIKCSTNLIVENEQLQSGLQLSCNWDDLI